MRVYGNKSVQGLPRDRSTYLAVKERVYPPLLNRDNVKKFVYFAKKSLFGSIMHRIKQFHELVFAIANIFECTIRNYSVSANFANNLAQWKKFAKSCCFFYRGPIKNGSTFM